MTRNQKLIWGGFCGCLLLVVCAASCLGGFLFLINKNGDNIRSVDTYAKCVAAGYPVLESYPARCITPDGRSFVDDSVKAVPPTDTSTTPTPTPAPDVKPTPTPTPAPTATKVKVYFAKDPSSYDDFNIAVGVDRSSTRTDIATYSIEQLIAGPTATEEIGGLFTPLKLTGMSNCGGKDFSLGINQTTKAATFVFCRDVVSAGVGDDARIKNTITKTLTQFSTITSVVIADKNGYCFGDESGMMTQCIH